MVEKKERTLYEVLRVDEKKAKKLIFIIGILAIAGFLVDSLLGTSICVLLFPLLFIGYHIRRLL